MENIDKHLEDISEIRSLMEQSSKFLSLSGISGVAVGVVGLLAAGFVYWYTGSKSLSIFDRGFNPAEQTSAMVSLVLNSVIAFILALALAILFAARMASRKGQTFWSPSAKYLSIHLFVPLFAGGCFCVMLLLHGALYLIAPAMLIFYGLALLNASKFTLNEIRYLGYAQLTIGLLAAVWIEYGLWFWALGFGVFHIINGILMYYRYEK